MTTLNGLKSYLQYFLNGYLENKKKDFKGNEFIKYITSNAKNIIPQNNVEKEKYLTKASCGQGVWAEIPWLAIFDKSITDSATKGYYIVFLIKSDCSGFYLSLNQGFTFYEENFKGNSKESVKKVSKYWQSELNTIQFDEDKPFSIDKIDLNAQSKNPRLPRGYELGNIVSKFYSKADLDNLSEDELLSDLEQFKIVYHELSSMLASDFKEQIIHIVNSSSTDGLDIALEIKNNKNKKFEIGDQTPIPKDLSFKEEADNSKRRGIKRDYLQQQKAQMENGLEGEKFVMEIERKRLSSHENEKLRAVADSIKHVSQQEGDGLGYDVLSFDIKGDDVQEIYIEVKSTKGNIDTPFFMSPNELAFAREKKDQFRIYRLYKGEYGKLDYYIIEDPLKEGNEKIQYKPVSFAVLPKN